MKIFFTIEGTGGVDETRKVHEKGYKLINAAGFVANRYPFIHLKYFIDILGKSTHKTKAHSVLKPIRG